MRIDGPSIFFQAPNKKIDQAREGRKVIINFL